MYNEINSTLLDGHPLDPLMMEIGGKGKEATIYPYGWCSGFLQGMSLRKEIWLKHRNGALNDLIIPILVLVSDKEIPEASALLEDPEKKDALISMIPDAVLEIYNFWRNRQEQPVMPHRKEKKIGRNDPCPCGSGKKYKKCCMGKERILH